MAAGLGKSASRGAAVILGGQGVRMVVQFSGIIIMARLLSPADYGVLAMVTAIIGVAEIFRDFGLSSAAIQAKSLSRGQQDNLFWMNTGIGLALSVIVVASSGLIAHFYDDPRLQPLTAVLAIVYLLNGVSTQFRAYLTRSLSFARLTGAEIVGQSLGLATGITCAMLGMGYWALAAQQIAVALFAQVALIFVTPWFPRWIDRTASIRPFLKYGSNLLGAHLLGYASRNADSVIIGARFGASDLGLYNRAFQLMMMPLLQINAPATRVALPVLSRLQDQRERYASFILFGQSALLMAVSFAFALVGAQASSVITLALGTQWLAAIPIFQILLIAGFFNAAGYATYWVFLSKGLTKANLRYALATRPAMIALLVIGSIWGVNGVAAAYALGAALTWPIGLIWIARHSDAPARQMFANGLRTIIIFGLATVSSYASTMALPDDAYVLRLVVGFVAVVTTLALIALVWPTFRHDVIELVRIRRHFKRSRLSPDRAESDGPADSADPAEIPTEEDHADAPRPHAASNRP
jgi:polysaccharide transporter, PST family